MANTRDVMGDQACLDALIADTLTSFEDDGCTKIGEYGLTYKTTLDSLKMPSCQKIEGHGLENDSSLTTVDILGGGSIGLNAFANDSKFTHLVLRSTTLTNLASTNAFYMTSFDKKEGAVYVPSDLVSEYSSATNWRNYLIRPISQYPLADFSTITDSWDDIITACGNGTYSSRYNVGDTKSIEIDGVTYYMQLVAKDADVLASDGTTTVPTTWLIYYACYSTLHNMDGSGTTTGGWADSGMRSWLVSDVLPLIPSNVRSAIKEVRKYSSIYENGGIVKDDITNDKLWIPSTQEVNSSYGTTYESQCPVYSGVFTDANYTRVKCNQLSSTCNWWLRSAYSERSYFICSNQGSVSSLSSNGVVGNNGVVFGFCI